MANISAVKKITVIILGVAFLFITTIQADQAPLIPPAPQNIHTLKNIIQQAGCVSERISTGKKINGPGDDPQMFVLSETLASKAEELKNISENIERGIQVLNTTCENLQALVRSAEYLKDTALSAYHQTASTSQFLASIYDSSLSQIDNISSNAKIFGTNLLDSSGKHGSNTLKINESITRSSKLPHTLIITGTNIKYGIGATKSGVRQTQNYWADDADVDIAVFETSQFINDLTNLIATYGAYARNLEIRKEMVDKQIFATKISFAQIVGADAATDASDLAALNQQQGFATHTLATTNKNRELFLKLLS